MDVIMMGASGAVGGHAAATLAKMPEVGRLITLGRSMVTVEWAARAEQLVVDVTDAGSYGTHLEWLSAVGFERLSLFHPSMILTPTNRYGFAQAVTLKIWPRFRPLLGGPLRKLRGVEVARLGRAMALNVAVEGSGEEVLEWDDFERICGD
jgi:hypothetical protein